MPQGQDRGCKSMAADGMALTFECCLGSGHSMLAGWRMRLVHWQSYISSKAGGRVTQRRVLYWASEVRARRSPMGLGAGVAQRHWCLVMHTNCVANDMVYGYGPIHYCMHAWCDICKFEKFKWAYAWDVWVETRSSYRYHSGACMHVRARMNDNGM